MTDPRPLHVRVATALGWTELVESHTPPMWLGTPPPELSGYGYQYISAIDRERRVITVGSGSVPHYDTDWQATGPLIERLRIRVAPGPTRWCAVIEARGIFCRYGDTPLESVCLLLISLHEAGKLADLLK